MPYGGRIDSQPFDKPWRWDRALGCVLGAAIGDSIFGGAGEIGEFGMATELAILEAHSFVEAGAIEPARPLIFDNFQQWLAALPHDEWPGFATVVHDWRGMEGAAERALLKHKDGLRDSSCLTRASFAATRWSFSYGDTAYVARRFCRVTHADPAAVEARVLLHEIISTQRNLERKPLGEPELSRRVTPSSIMPEFRDLAQAVLVGDDFDSPNGEPWGCLRDAVKAVRETDSFEDCVGRAVDFAGDTRAVAVVAGAIAGIRYGASEIPTDWVSKVGGSVLGKRYEADDLGNLLKEHVAVASDETLTGFFPRINDEFAARYLDGYERVSRLSPAEMRYFERFHADEGARRIADYTPAEREWWERRQWRNAERLQLRDPE